MRKQKEVNKNKERAKVLKKPVKKIVSKKRPSQIKKQQLSFKSKIDFKIAISILLFCFVFASILIIYFWKKASKEMDWEIEPIQKRESYEKVLLSMEKGIIKEFEKRSFIIQVNSNGIEFNINANTRLYNESGQKISDQPDFNFSDYLKQEREVRVLYAQYETFKLASEIWCLDTDVAF